MLNKILPILITLIAVGGAGFAALQIKGAPQRPEKEVSHEGGHDGGGEHGGGDHGEGGVHKVEAAEPKNQLGYLDFQRNFIIPVVGENRVDALILLTFSIEMDASKIEEARTREPRIRDAFMKTLLTLSHEGVLSQDITDPDVYTIIQERLLATAKSIVDEDVESILLVDFARQDQ